MKISKLDLKPEIIDFLNSEGYEELFEPQEEAVKAGLFDDKKNILVTIPTASGKTLIAMLATLSHLSKHKTKVVYLTPLRALTSEKFEEFKFKKTAKKTAGTIFDNKKFHSRMIHL